MTIALWIIGVLLCLILLLCLLRVGVRLCYLNGQLTADVTVWRFHFRVVPAKQKPEKAVGAKPEPEKTAVAEKKPKMPGPSFAEIRQLLRQLWPPLKCALGRTRRSIRINPCQLSLTVGGEEDPAAAAQLYGELHGAVWTVMPALEQMLRIQDPYVHIGIDFDVPETSGEGTIGVSIRVGTVLRMAWTVGIPALRWFLDWQKRNTPKTPAPAAAATK